MTLYCFIFGMAAFAAVRENKQFLYGAFCILLAVLTNFQRAGASACLRCLFYWRAEPAGGCPGGKSEVRPGRGICGGGQLLAVPGHPLVLELLPNTAMGGAAAWLCFAGVYAVCLMVCYALYTHFCAPVLSSAFA